MMRDLVFNFIFNKLLRPNKLDLITLFQFYRVISNNYGGRLDHICCNGLIYNIYAQYSNNNMPPNKKI